MTKQDIAAAPAGAPDSTRPVRGGEPARNSSVTGGDRNCVDVPSFSRKRRRGFGGPSYREIEPAPFPTRRQVQGDEVSVGCPRIHTPNATGNAGTGEARSVGRLDAA